MKTTTTILPGVKAIGWLDCDLLTAHVALRAVAGMEVPVFTAVTPIAFFGEAECSRTSKRDGAQRSESAALKFNCAEPLPVHLHLGFVVETVDGRHWLIGGAEAPFPVVDCERRAGSPSGEPAGLTYEVSHTALRTLIECIV